MNYVLLLGFVLWAVLFVFALSLAKAGRDN
jgi:hypothetical protein